MVNSLYDQFGTEGQFNISWEASDNIALDDAFIYLFNDELLVDVLINSVNAQIVDEMNSVIEMRKRYMTRFLGAETILLKLFRDLVGTTVVAINAVSSCRQRRLR